jgi:hypothetical protein
MRTSFIPPVEKLLSSSDTNTKVASRRAFSIACTRKCLDHFSSEAGTGSSDGAHLLRTARLLGIVSLNKRRNRNI